MKTAQTIAQNNEKNSELSPRTGKPKRRQSPSQLANLVAPFQPGESGNPSGRPKDSARNISRQALENNADAIYKAVVEKLLAGDAYAYSVHADRAFGKLKQGIIHTGDEEGGPIQASIKVEFVNPPDGH